MFFLKKPATNHCRLFLMGLGVVFGLGVGFICPGGQGAKKKLPMHSWSHHGEHSPLCALRVRSGRRGGAMVVCWHLLVNMDPSFLLKIPILTSLSVVVPISIALRRAELFCACMLYTVLAQQLIVRLAMWVVVDSAPAIVAAHFIIPVYHIVVLISFYMPA